VILAGGRATRLAGVADRPKPLIDVGGRPFLVWLLEDLARFGIEHVLCLAGPRAAEFERLALQLGIPSGFPDLRIEFLAEPESLGTGGALRLALPAIKDRALVLNGDSICDLDLSEFLRFHEASGAALSLVGVQVEDCRDFGRLRLASGDRLLGFEEKSAEGPGLINAGVYLIERRVLDSLPPGPSSLERDVLPPLVSSGEVGVYRTSGYFFDIGTPGRLALARAQLPQVRGRAQKR